MLDGDDIPGKDAWLTQLYEACPALARTARIVRPSTSSYIFDKDGTELRGLAGIRLYVAAADAADIPRAGKTLFKRLWLAQHGRIALSASGAYLVRGAIDACVFSPERLDFVAGAQCKGGLRQGPLTPEYLDGAPVLDTRAALPDLTEEEEAVYERRVEEAKTARKAEAERTRNAYIADRSDKIATARNIPLEEAREVARAAVSNKAELGGPWTLMFDKWGAVTVADVLREPGRYDKATLADPLEPDYNGGRNIARFYANEGTPYIHSFAHGGKLYRLRDPAGSVQGAEDWAALLAREGKEAVYTRLETLPRDEYDHHRKVVAKVLGCGVGAVDAGVADIRAASARERSKKRKEAAAAQGGGTFKHTETLNIARAWLKAWGGNLVHHQGVFYQWEGTHYAQMSVGSLRTALYSYLDKCLSYDAHGNCEPFHPTKTDIDQTLDALESLVFLSEDVTAPSWIKGGKGPPASEIVPVQNGLYHVPTGNLLPHTPAFFNLSCRAFEYDAKAACPQWETFLQSVWEDDAESIECLSEWFGLLMTEDTRYQKILLTVGPKRSGKGTIVRVLRSLVGDGGFSTSMGSALGGQFGLQPLIGRSVCVVPDARVGGKDVIPLVERLLSVSGEDPQSIPRKYLTDWQGRLPVRFCLLSNIVPTLNDASGALASRLIILQMTRSFIGKEDMGLEAKLEGELPGIFLWAMAGLSRLRERGYFIQPRSAAHAVSLAQACSSPVSEFLAEECLITPELQVSTDDLYLSWKVWCEQNGREKPGTKQWLSRDLHALMPDLKPRKRTKQIPKHGWLGIGLRCDHPKVAARMDGALDQANAENAGYAGSVAAVEAEQASPAGNRQVTGKSTNAGYAGSVAAVGEAESVTGITGISEKPTRIGEEIHTSPNGGGERVGGERVGEPHIKATALYKRVFQKMPVMPVTPPEPVLPLGKPVAGNAGDAPKMSVTIHEMPVTLPSIGDASVTLGDEEGASRGGTQTRSGMYGSPQTTSRSSP
jgi:P4 family phage/plasmid primase-like protien